MYALHDLTGEESVTPPQEGMSPSLVNSETFILKFTRGLGSSSRRMSPSPLASNCSWLTVMRPSYRRTTNESVGYP